MKNTLKLTITAACLVMALVQSGLGQQGSVPTSLAAAEESDHQGAGWFTRSGASRARRNGKDRREGRQVG